MHDDFLDCKFTNPIEFEDDILVPLGFRPSTPAWRAIVKADYGASLTDEEHALYLQLSGGVAPRVGGSSRILDIIGRRGGKSETRARCAFYECTCVPHTRYLAPGQRGVFAILSQERDVSSEVFRYLAGFNEFPELAECIDKVHDTHNDRRVVFRNGLEARVITATTRSVRGPTWIGAVLDEVAFWPHDGEARDVDVIDAFTPGLARSKDMPPRRCWALSSANIRRGWAWETFDRAYGSSESVWTVRSGASTLVRPNLDEDEIAADCEGRPGKREREYECVWGSTAATAFFDAPTIAACVDADRGPELPPRRDGVRYVVALDAAFVGDEFSLAVAESHKVGPETERA
ncbi:MAG: hypothetical protein KF764_28885, partial [Labilithrix sp.]|nr:hypothetical protein [Labilithrix sp.]